MATNNDEDDGFPLSPKGFVKRIEEEVSSLIQALIRGTDNDDRVRGEIKGMRKALEIFLNKKE